MEDKAMAFATFYYLYCLQPSMTAKPKAGPSRELNLGPPAPEAGIILLDHWASDEGLAVAFPSFFFSLHCSTTKSAKPTAGPSRELNPGPPAPEAGIILLDHWACHDDQTVAFVAFISSS